MVWDIHCVFPWLQGSSHRKLGARQRSEGIVLRNKEARQTDLSQNQKTRGFYGSGNQIQLSSANSKAESWDFTYQCISGEENRLYLKSHEKENADPDWESIWNHWKWIQLHLLQNSYAAQPQETLTRDPSQPSGRGRQVLFAGSFYSSGHKMASIGWKLWAVGK